MGEGHARERAGVLRSVLRGRRTGRWDGDEAWIEGQQQKQEMRKRDVEREAW